MTGRFVVVTWLLALLFGIVLGLTQRATGMSSTVTVVAFVCFLVLCFVYAVRKERREKDLNLRG